MTLENLPLLIIINRFRLVYGALSWLLCQITTPPTTAHAAAAPWPLSRAFFCWFRELLDCHDSRARRLPELKSRHVLRTAGLRAQGLPRLPLFYTRGREAGDSGRETLVATGLNIVTMTAMHLIGILVSCSAAVVR